MAIRMVVCDMDGTLLRSDQTVSAKTRHVLTTLRDHGVVLTLASGRNRHGIERFFPMLGMDQGTVYGIAVNGQQMFTRDDPKTVKLAQIPKALLHQVWTFARQQAFEFIAVDDTTQYYWVPESMREEKRAYAKQHGLDPQVLTGGVFAPVYRTRNYTPANLDDYSLPEQVNKVVLARADERLQASKSLIDDTFPMLDFSLTSAWWAEAVVRGLSKGRSLQKLCASLNILPEEVLVFGDGENDVSMFSLFPNSVAMATALPQVKAVARHETLSCDEDGVARFIAKVPEFHKLIGNLW